MDRSESALSAEDPNLGRTLRERYRLEERIGSGSMGSVYRAFDVVREQACAVKLLRLHMATRESVVIRFCDEARIIARLYHPGIVELYDQGEEPDGTLFLVMELLRGQDLYAQLRDKPRLPLGRVLEIVRQVGSALHTVHLSGVVHRDIKPRNVFLTLRPDSAEPGPVKVIDFGLAKILDGQGSSRGSDGLLIGTPEYLAPEAWRGISSEIDARSDQWSLAVLTYRMLAGRLPFEMSSDTVMLARAILSASPCPLRQVLPDLPVHVETAVAQALAKDKERRFPSVLDFIRALHGLPPAGTIKLRRDPATALLDYRDQPTAALVDYRERPTAAMVEHDEGRTVACHRLRDSTAMLMPAALSAGAESTALLGAPALAQRPVPASGPVLLAESVPTLPGSSRVPRTLPWRWVTPVLLLLAALALRSLPWTRPGPPTQAAAAPLRAFEHPNELAPPPVPLTPPAIQLTPPPFMPPAAASSPPAGAVKPVHSPQLRRPRMPASGAGNKTSAADQANAPVSLHLRRG